MTSSEEEVPVLNPAESEKWIRTVKNDIARGVPIVTNAEKDWKAKKRVYDNAWAFAIQRAEGPEYLRKAEATIATRREREEMDDAEIVLKHAERTAKALERELFAAMAVNSNIRAMWTAAGVGE